MKKIILALLLPAMIILSGCFAFTNGYYNAVPNKVISESLILRMKNNADTHSIEGFTAQSTFGDVLEKVSPSKISQANLAYNTEFLGYPAVVEYVFDRYGGSLRLDFMAFTVYPDNEKRGYESAIKELASKLDAEFGSHKYTDEFDSDDYFWRLNNWHIDMWKEGHEGSGEFAVILIRPGAVMFGILPETPDICPYRFGTDIETVYRNETPAALPDSFDGDCYLAYVDDGIEIKLRFEIDETGIRLSEGRYDMLLNDMGFENSLDYFESLADCLETVMGAALSRGYGIPDVHEDETGISISHSLWNGGQGLSTDDILNSGGEYYWLDMNWPGINLNADYGS